jgi:DNA-directed RNA polymerase subunit M/transcription elongation factor TFIIS
MNRHDPLYEEIMYQINRMIQGTDGSPDFGKSLNEDVCPYCYGEELAIVTKKIRIGRGYFFVCLSCKKRWGIETNKYTGRIKPIVIENESHRSDGHE